MDGLPASLRIGIDDCWNRIGVRGDASCPKLAEYVHCRNCPVHAEAATRLLDAPPPEGYLSHWTGLYAREERQLGRDTLSLFLFRIEAEWLALPALSILEVAPLRPVHSLPRRRDGAFLGLANVRGRLLACVSLAAVLGLRRGAEGKEKKNGKTGRLLVIDLPGGPLSFPVEEAHGIVHARPEALRDVPATVAASEKVHTKAILPWKDRSAGCLDETLLFAALNRSLA